MLQEGMNIRREFPVSLIQRRDNNEAIRADVFSKNDVQKVLVFTKIGSNIATLKFNEPERIIDVHISLSVRLKLCIDILGGTFQGV